MVELLLAAGSPELAPETPVLESDEDEELPSDVAAGPFLFPGAPFTPGPELGVFVASDFALDELLLWSAPTAGTANRNNVAIAVAAIFMGFLLRLRM